ncbi:MAG: arylsulfatase [Planctomycetota bacterium]|nr:MAG: arylsulfatase [Planctomycetota bacterium]REK20118.1 MAG: arylsulfatase [Planctomycetota bacterium]REK34308.1 MAG: arylsulfatase [Planctomycetota bacterium]
MQRYRRPLVLACLALAACGILSPAAARCEESRTGPPNIVLIMADDMGYSDLGCYGGEIKTPQLDALAAGGLRFTQFYNTARCWPTRAALLTGYYAQQVCRDEFPDLPGQDRGNRPGWAPLLPSLLDSAGYRSYHSGKWHIDGMPVESGFHRSYLLRDQGRFFHPRRHFEDDRTLPPVEPESGFYATTAIADHAIRCLRDHAAHHAGAPFFHYVAFTAPHFPLHALPEDIERYRNHYQVGWDRIRDERRQRQREMGIAPGLISDVERDVGPPYHFPEALKILGPGEVNRPLPWSDLTAEQQEFQAEKMALHAAMIDRMDREIGRIVQQLKEMEVFDETLILFLSDNGASAEIMVRDDGHDPSAPPGSAETHLCLGPGWSTVSNTPFRRHKTWVHEGGICTPLIVHWPNGISARGELRNNPGHVIDVVPTLLELAGGERPAEFSGSPVPAPPGVSLVPAFTDDGSVSHDSLWWSHEGNRAIRVGDFKLVAAAGEDWELFNLREDRAETNDLAETHPEKVAELSQLWTAQRDKFHQLATADADSQ